MSSNSYEATGRIHRIGETQQITETFTKRGLVLEIGADTKYPDTVEIEFTGDRGDLLDHVSVGQDATVRFSLRGREYDKRDGSGKGVFTSLTGWEIKSDGAAAPAADDGGWG